MEMAASFRLLLLAALLLPAAAGPQPCEPALLATRVARFCATDITSDHCCEPLLAAVDLHGGGCLCRVAAELEPKLAAAGLNATGLLTSCGGLLRADLAACQCQGTEPAPPAVVFTPPPSPGPRTQQPPLADEATTEKQPPHQRDAHSKAPLAPAAVSVISPAPHSGASSSQLLYSSTVVRDHVSGPAPPAAAAAAVVFAPPHSPGPRRKLQPPHKALPSATHPTTSSLVPAAAISPAVPHSAAGSSSSVQVYVSGALYDNKCAARQLADRLVLTCDTSENAPSPICCQIVSTIVEQSCLCQVSEEAEVRESSHLGREHILSLYNICGGEQQVPPGQCGPVYPPPPPATLLQPPPSSSHHGRVSLSVLLPSLIGGLLGLLGIGYGIYSFVKWARTHGFLGGEQPRLPPRLSPRSAARAAALARAEASRETAGDVQLPVGAGGAQVAHYAV